MKVLFGEIREVAEEALDEEALDEFQFDMDRAEQHILDWKAHLMHAVHQDIARTDIVAHLEPEKSTFLLMDFAMKWERIAFIIFLPVLGLEHTTSQGLAVPLLLGRQCRRCHAGKLCSPRRLVAFPMSQAFHSCHASASWCTRFYIAATSFDILP